MGRRFLGGTGKGGAGREANDQNQREAIHDHFLSIGRVHAGRHDGYPEPRIVSKEMDVDFPPLRSTRRQGGEASLPIQSARRKPLGRNCAMILKHKITPCLWFDGTAEEAMNFYVSIFKNSKIVSMTRQTGPGGVGTVLVGVFQLDGQELLALNGGPAYKFTEAISLSVDCETQDEVDYFWGKLSAGGAPGQCGWLKD